jgi:hypothetical protein
MILVPRLHLKTTWVKLEIIRQILINPNVRIGLFSVTSRLVEQELRDIKVMLCNPALRELFPDIIPDPGKEYRNWDKSTANELTTRRDSSLGKPPQESQVTALGSGATIVGMHIDMAFCDDIIDPSTVTTAEQMKKTEDWWAYIQSVCELGAPITMTGTFYHYNDIYNKIIRDRHFPKSRIFIRKAIENNKLLYKSWFTFKDLDKIKKRQGNRIFANQYMLNPIPEEDQIFPGPQPLYQTLPESDYTYYITVDPSLGKEHSDETGIVIAAVNKSKFIYIVEAVGVKKDSNALADYIIQKVLQYRPLKVGIEYGLQEHLKYIIEARQSMYEHMLQRPIPLILEGIPITRGYSKASRVNWTLGAFVRQGKLRIHESCRDLISEMDTFTGTGNEKDNIVDAASMLITLIGDFHTGGYNVAERHEHGTFWDIFRRKPKLSWRGNFA